MIRQLGGVINFDLGQQSHFDGISGFEAVGAEIPHRHAGLKV
jgi:hypothetical protein